MKKRILIACEFSGIVRDAFRVLGFDARSCDLIESEGENKYHLKTDIRNVLNDSWDMIVAFPPCTHLCRSGAKYWQEKRRDGRQKEAIDFFMIIARAECEHIAIENPIGIISVVWRKPDQIIQPWQFGHGETKATCLWLKNLPLLKATNIVSGRYPATHFMEPGPNRSKDRSRTYQGIADAMAEQWGGIL